MKAERILRLYLRGNWPRLESACPWALLSPELKVIERGDSDPAQWPAADECEAVVTADQVSWLSISLPEKLGRDANQIIAYALEEKLLEPTEAMHIVLPRASSGAQKSAIAIRRSRLQEIAGAIGASGRRLDRLFTEMQLAPSAAGEWTVCLFGNTAFLRLGADLGLAIDWPATAAPDALMLAAARAKAQGELPRRVLVQCPPTLASTVEAWTTLLGVPVVAGGDFDPLLASTLGASNLLTGSFAPARGTGPAGRYLRLSVIALLLLGLVHTVLSLADWAGLAYQAAGLREEATAIYREAVPASKAPLLNPSVQLEREASTVLHERGKAGRTDMLTMLAALSAELPAGVQMRHLRFDPSALEVVAVLPGDSVHGLGPALRLRGYALDAAALRQDASGTEYKLRMSLR